ncbi:hypothetical protein [Gloeothece verrucosa]|uniref:Uncharacterized protein n=1 Tax=Gloeothece verrucosa (strain PCC 7822) TaxID=497965 RepID=E0U8H9_GLOV7|nr:hypothetical protein [Gloeothece verrucosa]ADN13725.1 hypothetical protein Cyan7822_1738 [Gloeothece verrucosa PCC 7822]
MINQLNGSKNYPENSIKEIHEIIDRAILESQNKFNALSEALQILSTLSQTVKTPSQQALLAEAMALIEKARL